MIHSQRIHHARKLYKVKEEKPQTIHSGYGQNSTTARFN